MQWRFGCHDDDSRSRWWRYARNDDATDDAACNARDDVASNARDDVARNARNDVACHARHDGACHARDDVACHDGASDDITGHYPWRARRCCCWDPWRIDVADTGCRWVAGQLDGVGVADGRMPTKHLCSFGPVMSAG